MKLLCNWLKRRKKHKESRWRQSRDSTLQLTSFAACPRTVGSGKNNSKYAQSKRKIQVIVKLIVCELLITLAARLLETCNPAVTKYLSIFKFIADSSQRWWSGALCHLVKSKSRRERTDCLAQNQLLKCGSESFQKFAFFACVCRNKHKTFPHKNRNSNSVFHSLSSRKRKYLISGCDRRSIRTENNWKQIVVGFTRASFEISRLMFRQILSRWHRRSKGFHLHFEYTCYLLHSSRQFSLAQTCKYPMSCSKSMFF